MTYEQLLSKVEETITDYEDWLYGSSVKAEREQVAGEAVISELLRLCSQIEEGNIEEFFFPAQFKQGISIYEIKYWENATKDNKPTGIMEREELLKLIQP